MRIIRIRGSLTLFLPADQGFEKVDGHVIYRLQVGLGVHGQQEVDLPLRPELCAYLLSVYLLGRVLTRVYLGRH